MRKDYISVTETTHGDETTFVEAYWTNVWENKLEMRTQIERVAKQDEYKLIQPYLRQLPKEAKIMDAGCGLGDWVIALSREGFKVTGLDLSRRAIELLKERFPASDFLRGDIRCTEFGDASYDAYYSWGVFEHFENGPQECIKEALRLLKPGGLIFISVPHDNVRQALRGSLMKAQIFPTNSRFYQYRFTRNELATELKQGGFEVLSVMPIHLRQGVLRFLHHELRMPYNWLLTRALAVILAPLVPKLLMSHMILAVAKKPIQ